MTSIWSNYTESSAKSKDFISKSCHNMLIRSRMPLKTTTSIWTPRHLKTLRRIKAIDIINLLLCFHRKMTSAGSELSLKGLKNTLLRQRSKENSGKLSWTRQKQIKTCSARPKSSKSSILTIRRKEISKSLVSKQAKRIKSSAICHNLSLQVHLKSVQLATWWRLEVQLRRPQICFND